MNPSAKHVQTRLFELKSDEAFAAFQSSLLPTLPSGAIIGVRMPALRRLAKELSTLSQGGSSAFLTDEFMQDVPHQFFEENSLHLILLSSINDFDECLKQTQLFLPFIDNWATCDIGLPAPLAKNAERLLPNVQSWLKGDEPYTVRFAVGALLTAYMGENFRPEYPELVAAASSPDYYVNMMRAWYFATALAKRWETALPYIEERRLDEWTHNKAIQKAIESARIPLERKKLLKELRLRKTSPSKL